MILLPPSEGKAAPAGRGRPVDIDALWTPGLAGARRKIVDALREASAGPDGAAVLGLTDGRRSELDLNLRLPDLPARPAGEVYTGVLYDALRLTELSSRAKRRANAAIRVQSALWGPIKITDRIPPYRLSIGTSLPGIGPLAGFWRSETADLDAPGELIIDCRSTGYATAWQPRSDKLIKVTALTEKDGVRSVVSHFAKHTRGVVARLLLEAERTPRTPQQVRDIIARHGHCELDRMRTGWQLSVITDAAGRLRMAADQ
ncbi:YaaA family protein [Microlunatus sp. Gsoil 973]|uniref:YaaA family protein n=1 Tax=Microlunatus sp. Gsoil 973 TaxID=2672569 RepID=UPI0018A80B02|nr:peroxide stress protein YaaA [Microlunatus sp. Gsoil 973]